MLHVFMKILLVEISLLLEGLISIFPKKPSLILLSSHIEDDKEENENTGATMTFTQKITCNKVTKLLMTFIIAFSDFI